MLKNKRIVNRKLLDSYHFMSCYVCGCSYGVVAHHLKSKKSGGHDVEFNLLPLCQECHVEVHTVGLTQFSVRYSNVEYFLSETGWQFSEYLNRWLNPDAGIN